MVKSTGCRGFRLNHRFGLTMAEDRLWNALSEKVPQPAETLAAVALDNEEYTGSVKVHFTAMRAKLRPHGWGIASIVNSGYLKVRVDPTPPKRRWAVPLRS